ncbi:unnamed protein product [Trifolium pratense]|uniref:Uncharacterized protein n=1 Tax=Trifolium pratense TaxID=57577 RepID=A0ACB0KQL1_TRIPR|nr:unnamed protein product [Trifolium pratense]
MAEILKFACVMIILLFIMCIIVTNGIFLCDRDRDCPKPDCLPEEYPKCVRGVCKCIQF